MADMRKGEHHANRAREMLRQGRLADAERELRAAVASDPTRGDWMLNLGWTLEATGKLDEALQLYRQSCSLLPTARDPRLAEGLVLAKLARHDEAATALAKAKAKVTLPNLADVSAAGLAALRGNPMIELPKAIGQAR